MKKKKKIHFWYYLNKNNLIGQIEHYGYVFSLKKMILSFVATIALCSIGGLLFRMSFQAILVLLIFMELLTPALFCTWYHSLYEQKRFSDTSRYIEKMLMYFKKSKKILNALEDTLKIFPDGQMHDVIEATIAHIKFAAADHEIEEEALKKIEAMYNCERIKTLHGFLLSVERDGGDSDMGVELLIQDRSLWTERIALFQNEKNNIRKDISIGLIMSAVLCLLFVWAPTLVRTDLLDVHSLPMVQISTLLYLMFEIIIYYKSEKKMCFDWLDTTSDCTEEEWTDKYERFVHPNIKQDRKKSCLYCGIGVILTSSLTLLLGGLGTVTGKIVALLGCGISVFLLFSYKVGYKVLKDDLKKEIKKTYPSWLIHLALLMQNENVQQSLFQSYDTAPGVIKPGLKQMLKTLNEDPNDVNAYITFLREFNIEDIEETMDSLYGITHGAGGIASEEFKLIINRNNKMIDQAEKIRNDEKATMFKAYSGYTTLAASVMLIVYMCAMMFAFLNMSI